MNSTKEFYRAQTHAPYVIPSDIIVPKTVAKILMYIEGRKEKMITKVNNYYVLLKIRIGNYSKKLKVEIIS